MEKKIVVMIPAAVKDSPVKGAVALANELCRHRSVCFVTLKDGDGEYHSLDQAVERVSIWKAGSWPKRIMALRRLFRKIGTPDTVASISSCLSADYLNSCCRDLAVTCSSVRGNLPKVYSETFGKMGRFIAYCHLKRLGCLDHVVSMTIPMAKQVHRVIGRASPIIGNFLDEGPLSKFRRTMPNDGPFQFVYTGSLLNGKQPELLIRALRVMQDATVDARLNIYGDGPLLPKLKGMARTLTNPQAVRFYGYVAEPFAGVAAADVFVLPSVSEGVSRSVLEALFLGVPCILRDVDGNSDLVRSKVNGTLFDQDERLAEAMIKTAEWSRQKKLYRNVLVPDAYRQQTAAKMFIDLLETDR